MTNALQFIQKGEVLMGELEFPQAEQAFQQALQLDSRSADALIWLGRIALIKDKDVEAVNLFDRALSIDPRSAEALALKGVHFMKIEDFHKAIEILEQAKASDPSLQMTYFNLGKCYSELGKFEKAEQNLSKAIEMNPNHFQAYSELSYIFGQTGRVKEGIEALLKAIRINPLYLKAYLILGALYKNAGKGDLVIRLYEAGIQNNPNAFPLREELCALYMLKLDFKRAYQQAIEIVKRRNDYGDYLRLGNVAIASGMFEEAEKAYKTAIELNPRRWEAHYDLAELYMSAHLMDEARTHYETAVKNNEKSYKPFNGMGYLLLMVDHNWDKAIENFKRALELGPDRPEPMLNIALAYAEKGEVLAAKKYATAAMKIVKSDNHIYREAERLLKTIANEKRK